MTISIQPAIFFASTGEKIAATLYMPTASPYSKKFPAIILCQGLSGTQTLVLPQVAHSFAEAGFVALTFDYRGFGQSEGQTGIVDPQARSQDALDACNFVRAHAQVDPRRVGIYGHSLGGGVAQYAASYDEALQCVVSTSGFSSGDKLLRSLRSASEWLEFKEILDEDRIQRALSGKSKLVEIEDIFPLSTRFQDEYAALGAQKESSSIPENRINSSHLFQLISADFILQFDTTHLLPKICPKPILFIHGAKDDIIPLEDVMEAYRLANEPKKLIIFDDYDHVGLDHGPGLEQVISLATDWFNKHL